MSTTALAVQQAPVLVKASDELSAFLGMEKGTMIAAIKAQCFKGRNPDEVTDAQLATYVSTANVLKLNPLLPGQMYPYPDRNGAVTVMIGPDGVFTLLSNHPDVVAQKDGGAAFWTEHGVDAAGKETCTGYINHRTKGLLKKTIWVDEWVVGNNPNWQTRRHHMSEIRALKQTARMVIHGLPVDSDEHKLGEMLNVTDSAPEPVAEQPKVERATPPPRARKGAAAVAENAKPAESAPVDVAATPVAEPVKEAPKAAPAEEKKEPAPKAADPVVQEKKEEKAAAPAPAPAPKAEEKKVGRAFLKDAEEISAICQVKDVSPLVAKLGGVATPSVQSTVAGDFIGLVYHFGGAEMNGDNVVPNPLWKAGTTVKLTLLGKLNSKTAKVLPTVQKIEAVEASPEAMEVD